jgi:hypothetical protein
MHLLLPPLLFALGATPAVPLAQQCALAEVSCHTTCDSLRDNLNICLCNTRDKPEDACRNTQVAYVCLGLLRNLSRVWNRY